MKIWRQLAKERSYHGFMAADRLQSEYQIGHVALTVNRSKIKWLSELPGIKRARELYLLERIQEARREWVHVVRELDGEKLKAAAQLAHNWGWHERTIFTLAQGKQWDDMELRFPLEHRREVEAMARQQQLDSAWVFAVIRQESAFMRDALSPVGAQGLMQLMPKTARAEARKLGLRAPRGKAVLQPELNIKLGSAHLRRAMDELAQNQVLATAAYNAGVHRVHAWMPDEAMEADLWIAMVPFKETRTYLQRVLAYSIIYQQRLGLEQQRLATIMTPIRPFGSP
jgi:soluble lytic murein transglycosylase